MTIYSILDPSRTELAPNATVRIDDGRFKGSFITYNPILLNDNGDISYGVVMPVLQMDHQYITNGNINDNLSENDRNDFLSAADDIFQDLLTLFKDNIQYG